MTSRCVTYPLTRHLSHPRRQKAMEDADADCCDVAGEHVLASEIDAWKLPNQVFGGSGVGEAQEERARAQCRLKDDGEIFILVFIVLGRLTVLDPGA